MTASILLWSCIIVGAHTISDDNDVALELAFDSGQCTYSQNGEPDHSYPEVCRDDTNSAECRQWVKCENSRNRVRDVQAALKHTYEFFEPRPVPNVVYFAFIMFSAMVVGLIHIKRRWLWGAGEDELEFDKIACHFLDNPEGNLANPQPEQPRRPLVRQQPPPGGYFHPQHCPLMCNESMQPWYCLQREYIYASMMAVLPKQVWLFSLTNVCIGGIVWSVFFIGLRNKFLKEKFVTFNGDGNWFTKETNYLGIVAHDVSILGGLFKTMLALLLLYMVRQRLRWMETLKTKVWLVKRRVELTSFLTAGFIMGDDEKHQQTRHEIYRWLMVAFFFNCRARSSHLVRYSVAHLKRSGLLSEEELDSIIEATRGSGISSAADARQAPGGGRRSSVRIRNRGEKESAHKQQIEENTRARDRLLWWIQVRILAAAKDKILEKEHKKKLLGVLWSARDAMEDMILESSRRQMYLWVSAMQLMVDCFLVTIPFNSLADMYHAHIWTLPWMMLRVFVTSFFYDLLLHVAIVLEEPFGYHVDDLNLDTVLVDTERVVFFNLSQKESADLPPNLSKTWAAVKDKKEEDDDKKDKKDKDKAKAGNADNAETSLPKDPLLLKEIASEPKAETSLPKDPLLSKEIASEPQSVTLEMTAVRKPSAAGYDPDDD